jgi:hypothetical protein
MLDHFSIQPGPFVDMRQHSDKFYKFAESISQLPEIVSVRIERNGYDVMFLFEFRGATLQEMKEKVRAMEPEYA